MLDHPPSLAMVRAGSGDSRWWQVSEDWLRRKDCLLLVWQLRSAPQGRNSPARQGNLWRRGQEDPMAPLRVKGENRMWEV